MRTVQFSERAVAFLDILGFKEVVREAHADAAGLKRLSQLIGKIQSNAPLNRGVSPTVPQCLHPQSLEISDSIVLSTPLTHANYKNYSGLAILVMRCSQIASILLEAGYLLSGAINVGPIQHTRRNIVGVGYQDAYALQSALCSPAIILCPNAVKEWQNTVYGVSPPSMCLHRTVIVKQKNVNGTVTSHEREAEIVNVFEPEYMNSVRAIGKAGPVPTIDDVWLKGRIQNIEALLSNNLALFAPGEPGHNPSALAKWQWFAQFFRDHGKPAIQARYSLHPDLIQ